jgi:hypothetical protein
MWIEEDFFRKTEIVEHACYDVTGDVDMEEFESDGVEGDRRDFCHNKTGDVVHRDRNRVDLCLDGQWGYFGRDEPAKRSADANVRLSH